MLGLEGELFYIHAAIDRQVVVSVVVVTYVALLSLLPWPATLHIL
jgi:hypothetical protein